MDAPSLEIAATAMGDRTGIALPAHRAAFAAMGEEFLTRAFHAFGSLDPHNRVAHIVSCKRHGGGNSGDKLAVQIEYERPEKGLHSQLFVKFSRDFEDAFRDRRRYELEPEVSFALFSRTEDFPIRVPKPYFADFNASTGTGILITEAVPFGSGDIEPLHSKCMDQMLSEPLDYYRAVLKSIATLAAAQKTGQLSPDAECFFPYDGAISAADPAIAFSEEEIRARLQTIKQFALETPQLLPAGTAEAFFLDRFEVEALYLFSHAQTIRDLLHRDESFIALCHWNAHLDNAWFRRLPDGGLECGLFDWGRVRQMNVAYALWGCLGGGSLELWHDHIDHLLAYFADEYHRLGGPALTVDMLRNHLDLYIGLIGLSQMMDVPEIVNRRLPDARRASGIHDPLFLKDEIPRTFLYIFGVFLDRWKTSDIGGKVRSAILGAGDDNQCQ